VFAGRLSDLSTNPVDTDPFLVHVIAALEAGEGSAAVDTLRAAAALDDGARSQDARTPTGGSVRPSATRPT
jgi:hypothetical protein